MIITLFMIQYFCCSEVILWPCLKEEENLLQLFCSSMKELLKDSKKESKSAPCVDQPASFDQNVFMTKPQQRSQP